MSYIFPVPPLSKWYVRFFHWLKSLYKKEPVGFVALIITVSLASAPLIKEVYYSIVGPSYSAIVDFRYPMYPFNSHNIIVTIENYSGIPVQGLEASFSVIPDSPKVEVIPSSIVIGTIPSYTLSKEMYISLSNENSGKEQLHIQFQPINENSNVSPKSQDVPFTIGDLK